MEGGREGREGKGRERERARERLRTLRGREREITSLEKVLMRGNNSHTNKRMW